VYFTSFFRSFFKCIGVYTLFFIFLFITLLGGLLGGCAHTPSSPAPLCDSAKQSEQKEKLSNWIMEGKVAASNAKGAHSASFVWEQQGPIYKIKFFGPLGIAGGCLRGDLDNDKTVFISYNGKKSYAASAQVLIYHQTGLYFPVPSLVYWLQGLIDPALKLEYSRHDPSGVMQELKQGGWLIQYLDYRAYHFAHTERLLPCNIKIKKDDITIKIIIHNWE